MGINRCQTLKIFSQFNNLFVMINRKNTNNPNLQIFFNLTKAINKNLKTNASTIKAIAMKFHKKNIIAF